MSRFTPEQIAIDYLIRANRRARTSPEIDDDSKSVALLPQIPREPLPKAQEFIVGPQAVVLLKSTHYPLRFLLFADEHVNRPDPRCAEQASATHLRTFLARLFKDPQVARPIDFFFEGFPTERYSKTELCQRRDMNFLYDTQCEFYECFVPKPSRPGCPYRDVFFHQIDVRAEPRFEPASPGKILLTQIMPLENYLRRLRLEFFGNVAEAKNAVQIISKLVDLYRPDLQARFDEFARQRASDPTAQVFVGHYVAGLWHEFDRQRNTWRQMDEASADLDQIHQRLATLVTTVDDVLLNVKLTFGWLRAYELVYADYAEQKDFFDIDDPRFRLITDTLFPQTPEEADAELFSFLAESKIWKQIEPMSARFPSPQEQGALAGLYREQIEHLQALYRSVIGQIRAPRTRSYVASVLEPMRDILTYFMDMYTVGRMLKRDHRGGDKENIVYYAGGKHWVTVIQMLQRLMPLVLPGDNPPAITAAAPMGYLDVQHLAFIEDPESNDYIEEMLLELFDTMPHASEHLRNDAAFQCLPLDYGQVRQLFARES